MIRVEPYRFPGCFDCLFVLADGCVFVSKVVDRNPVPRICVPPDFVVVDGLADFSADVLVIPGGQVKPLPLAGAFSQLKRFFQILPGQAALAQVGVHRAQPSISEGELRIDLACPLEESKGLGGLTLPSKLISLCEHFQSVERTGGGLLDGCAELPDRSTDE